MCETGALKAMDVAGCCQKSKDRVLVEKRKPGALWHIYEAQDSDKIRDLLKKVVFFVPFLPTSPHIVWDVRYSYWGFTNRFICYLFG